MKIPFKSLFWDYLKKEGKDGFTQQQTDSMFEKLEGGAKDLGAIFGPLFEWWEEFTKNFSNIIKHLGVNIKYVERDSIKFSEYTTLLSQNIVVDSNSIAVIKELIDGKQKYSSAYLKDGELLGKSENVYIIVMTKSVDIDFDAMFAESNIIILK